MARHQLGVRVLGIDDRPLEGAVVTVRPEAVGAAATAGYEAGSGLHVLDGLRPGFFSITVEHKGYQSQTRRVQVHPKPTDATFWLGRPGDAFVYRGSARVPYRSRPEFLGVIPAAPALPPALGEVFARLGLELQQAPAAAGKQPVVPAGPELTPAGVVIRLRDPRQLPQLLEMLRQHPEVAAAGPILWRNGLPCGVFTHRLHVRFRPEVTREEAEALLAKEGLAVADTPAIAAGFYVVAARLSIGEEINGIADRLVATERVMYAEPSLAEVPTAASVTPSDYLWPGLWDRRLVGLAGDATTPGAWQRLRDALGVDNQYGRPTIVVGIADSGVKSVNGRVDHPDFQGTVSDGNPKVYSLFDFSRLVQGNDVPVPFINGGVGDHGVACAGVAVGRADDASAVPAVAFGTAGAAPNARLLGIGYPHDTSRRANMWVWSAGLDPRSGEAGFPAAITPGADVLSTSVSWRQPLSGAEADAFDEATSHGRGGKGCLLFFAAGNDDADVSVRAAAASHERTFTCAASTLDFNGVERRAYYSNWGDPIDWCAPSASGGGYDPPGSYAVWTSSFLTNGQVPSIPGVVRTTLAADVTAAARAAYEETSTEIRVADASELTPHMWLHLGEIGTPDAEAVLVVGVPDPAAGRVLIRPPRHNHPANTAVLSGARLLTVLAADAQAGDTTIRVASTARLQPGLDVLIGESADPARTRESFRLAAPHPSDGPATPTAPLRNAHPAGALVLYTAYLDRDVEVGHLLAAANAGDPVIQVTALQDLPAGFPVVLQDALGETWLERERARISAIVDPVAGLVSLSAPLARAHARDTTELVESHAHHRNDFGGTSSATPLCAGIAALVLSARPDLTWLEVREILRNTAEKIDLDNATEQGRWRDANGDPCAESGLAPVFSRWYGYGRVNADRAVARALAYTVSRDLMLRDSLTDDGTTVQPISADSPDIWVRNADPALDSGALPAGYDVPGPHENPSTETARWIYARIRNRGSVTSLDAWLRFYVVAGGAPLRVPEDLAPRNGFGNLSFDAWERGSYFIGEVAVTAVAPGEQQIVSLPWPQQLVPPVRDANGQPWDPRVVVEVTPYDGPLRGAFVHENNNVAQKAITIADPAPRIEFQTRPASEPLPHELELGATGSRTMLLRVAIRDPGLFKTETIVTRVTWQHRDGRTLTGRYRFDGATWVETLDPGLSGAWFTGWIPSLNPDTPIPANGLSVASAFLNAALEVTGAFTSVTLALEASDLAGQLGQAAHALEIAIPTDTMLLLDYSGSMLGQDGAGHTKWDSAKEAANLFHAVYAALSSPTLGNRIGVVRFMHAPSTTVPITGARETEVSVPLRAPEATAPLLDVPAPGSPELRTPMGLALVTAHGAMRPPAGAPDWRQRVMILLTDGLENILPSLDHLRGLTDPAQFNFVPSVTEDPRLGYRIHACAFGPPGQVASAALQRLVMGTDADALKDYAGQLHSTETTSDPSAAAALKEQFLNLITGTLAAELVAPDASGMGFDVEPGVSVLVLVVTAELDFGVQPPAGFSGSIGPFRRQAGFSWLRVERPTAGVWSVSGFTTTESVRAFAVVDLTLRVRSDAGRAGLAVGRPVPLWTEIRDGGAAIHGATVTVTVDGPGEETGEVISGHASSPEFDRAKWRARWDALQQAGGLAEHGGTLLRELLDGALRLRGFPLLRRAAGVPLSETGGSGRYEGEWPYTAEAGTYSFRFEVEGRTRTGHRFRREYSVARHLEAVPDAGRTTMVVRRSERAARADAAIRYELTLTPRSASGGRLGPGLAERLGLVLDDGKNGLAELEAAITDNLDGSYGVSFELAPHQRLERLRMTFGSLRIPLEAPPPDVRRVRVTLRRVQVQDDHETWFPSPGELVFDAMVAPGGDPDRAARRRIPETGVLKLRDGEVRDLDVVLFDGYVEEGTTLDIVIGAVEIDRLLFLRREDPLVRHHRRLQGPLARWEGGYGPEAAASAAARDWNVWYDVVVSR